MTPDEQTLHFSIIDSLKAIPHETWDEVFGGRMLEGWAYHKTIEESGLQGFVFHYLVAERQGACRAIIPFFTMDFSFTTIIQGPLQQFILRIQKRWKRFLKLRILFVGFPTTEHLHLGIHPQEDNETVMHQALKELEIFCRQEKISTLLFYNLTEDQTILSRYLKDARFTRMENFPNTMLHITASSLDEYLNGLSKNTRKDLQKKLRRSEQKAHLTTSLCTDIEGFRDEIYTLYLNNFSESDVNFEILTPDYFCRLAANMPQEARFFITRDRDKIVAFNVCLVKDNLCIDKWIGFDKELALSCHLYYTTFCHNIAWCINNGISYYQMGITDYHPKIRLGARLIPLLIYVRLTNPLLNLCAGLSTRFIAPTRFDPTLQRLKKKTDCNKGC
jgi:uncharacterized protein